LRDRRRPARLASQADVLVPGISPLIGIAYAERWVGTLRRECLDRILIVNRRQLEHVLGVYAAHYNRHRPHRSLSLQPPDESASAAAWASAGRIRKHELLGGLINEYEAAA
jgi:putative transposase